VEVEATLDGARWSRLTAPVAFTVLRPWYRTWWFFALAAAALAGLLALGYRLRVGSLLRLERQRMRIAMDLHDEVGSGLGTIGVLAGILGRAGMADAQRDELATRAAGVAGELSQSLGDIVWSLRLGSDRLDALWARVLDRGQPLFAGGPPRLVIEAPDPLPRQRLSPAVCRNVSLMTIEALHNAARHAAASTVVLALSCDGAGYCVRVEDDGVGLAQDGAGDATRRGLGVEGMRARASAIGGSVTWERPAGRGTRVLIRFGRAGSHIFM
jgi:signal transduction histidine kinase